MHAEYPRAGLTTRRRAQLYCNTAPRVRSLLTLVAARAGRTPDAAVPEDLRLLAVPLFEAVRRVTGSAGPRLAPASANVTGLEAQLALAATALEQFKQRYYCWQYDDEDAAMEEGADSPGHYEWMTIDELYDPPPYPAHPTPPAPPPGPNELPEASGAPPA